MPRDIITIRRRGGYFTAAVAASYTAQGVSFNGSTYLHRAAGLTGAADGKQGILSFWFNLVGSADSTDLILWEDDASGARGVQIARFGSDNNMWVRGFGVGGAENLRLFTNATETSGGGWRHLLAAWDLSAGVGQLYVNNAPDLAGGTILLNANIAYASPADEFFGARNGGTSPYTGYFADFYLNQATTLDISDPAQRAKFISGGHPVNLGTDGSTPTGTAPIVYFSGAGAIVAPGGSVTSWATNKGTGLGFTIGAGSLTAAATNP